MLFTFPSRYWFTIGGREYLAFGGGPPEFLQGCSCPGVLGETARSHRPFVYRAVTVSGPAFQRVPLNRWFLTALGRYRTPRRPHDPHAATPVGLTRHRFRLTPVRSPLLGGSRLLSVPRGTKMFQFPRLPPARSSGSPPMTAVGLPHSGTPGSTPARGSPGRIVVRHALRRLSAPRHPPIALGSLITQNGSLGMPSLAGRRLRPQPHAGSKAPYCLPVRLLLHPVCSFQGAPSKRVPARQG